MIYKTVNKGRWRCWVLLSILLIFSSCLKWVVLIDLPEEGQKNGRVTYRITIGSEMLLLMNLSTGEEGEDKDIFEKLGLTREGMELKANGLELLSYEVKPPSDTDDSTVVEVTYGYDDFQALNKFWEKGTFGMQIQDGHLRWALDVPSEFDDFDSELEEQMTNAMLSEVFIGLGVQNHSGGQLSGGPDAGEYITDGMYYREFSILELQEKREAVELSW